MTDSTTKGNDPERWKRLLDALDEKLQLGLLDQLRKVASYHFESNVLYIEPASKEQDSYLRKESVFQQLELYAQDSIKVTSVKIRQTN